MNLVAPIVAGVASGTGLTLAIAQLLPKPPPELRSAVARLNSPLKESSVLFSDGPDTIGHEARSIIPVSLLTWLDKSGLVRATPEDLAIVGRTWERHSAEKVALAVAGFLLPSLLAVLATAAHIHLSIGVPVGLAVIFGTLCFFGPDIEVRGRAAKARTEFDKILHGYLVNVALERRASVGIVQAMSQAAAVGDSWVLHRIRTTLLAAQMANVTPWQALEELGSALGVTHLVEAAQTMRSASEEGTAVFTRLVAQAESLGEAIIADERAAANARSERMVVPVTLMGVIVMAVMAYPAFAKLTRVH